MLQFVSVNVPVETLWTRVWATTVVALPLGAFVLSLFGLRFDHSPPLSLIVLLFSLLGCIFMAATGLIVLLCSRKGQRA